MDKIKLRVLVSDEAGGKSDVNGHQNVRKSCLSITEPADDELSRDNKETYMASVFANCTQTWLESLKYHLGYQLDFNFDYGALNKLQPFPLNNFGDPFMKSNYGVNSKQFEVAVLDWFADLWGIHKDKYWGYITSGSTEANFHAIIMGREIFPDGILYASKESHYSVFKAARMYRMDCIKIETLTSGEIDCIDFKAKLLQNKDKPAIINVNIGTTFKAAVDDLDLVIQTLEECDFSHNQFYIHCDGALSGLIIPFVEQAPQISFKKPIHSASVSGHKFLGCPMPCGVLITRIEHINALSKNVEYIASRDVTISCSRNGHAPIFLWYILSKKGHIGLQKDIQKCLQNAKYLKDQLRSAGISVMLNELSNIVVFERPPDEEFIHRWQLSCQGNIAHVAVMPNVSKEKLDAFLDELAERRSTWSKEEGAHPCVGSDVGYENCVCLLHR